MSDEIKDYCVLIIPPDNEAYAAVWSLPKRESLMFHAALKLAVEEVVGPPLERVNVFADFYGGNSFTYLDMFVNGNGALPPDPLPINMAATAIYHNNVLFHEPGKFTADQLSPIHGYAVVFEERVWK